MNESIKNACLDGLDSKAAKLLENNLDAITLTDRKKLCDICVKNNLHHSFEILLRCAVIKSYVTNMIEEIMKFDGHVMTDPGYEKIMAIILSNITLSSQTIIFMFDDSLLTNTIKTMKMMLSNFEHLLVHHYTYKQYCYCHGEEAIRLFELNSNAKNVFIAMTFDNINVVKLLLMKRNFNPFLFIHDILYLVFEDDEKKYKEEILKMLLSDERINHSIRYGATNVTPYKLLIERAIKKVDRNVLRLMVHDKRINDYGYYYDADKHIICKNH